MFRVLTSGKSSECIFSAAGRVVEEEKKRDGRKRVLFACLFILFDKSNVLLILRVHSNRSTVLNDVLVLSVDGVF